MRFSFNSANIVFEATNSLTSFLLTAFALNDQIVEKLVE